jgi:hypothetical protein
MCLGVELHDGQNPEGSEVPGRGEFHDDGRCRTVPGFQQGQRDAGIRYFFPLKGLSHEIKVYASRPYLAFTRGSEMLGSGIFLL